MTARPINPGAEAHLGVCHFVSNNGGHIGSVTLRDYMGTDASVSRAARVSYGRGDAARGPDADARLIHFLTRHRHTTPCEMPELLFQIEAPIFVARQWLRHRTASVNERSLRYTEPTKDAEIMPAAGLSELCADPDPKDSKQGRGAAIPGQAAGMVAINSALMRSAQSYRALRAAGVSREQARSVLPVATMTGFVWKMDLHNLLHFIGLRTAPDAQRETRLLAEQVAAVVADAFPVVWSAWVEHVRDAPRLSASAWRALAGCLDPYALAGALDSLPERERRETMSLITAAWAAKGAQ